MLLLAEKAHLLSELLFIHDQVLYEFDLPCYHVDLIVLDNLGTAFEVLLQLVQLHLAETSRVLRYIIELKVVCLIQVARLRRHHIAVVSEADVARGQCGVVRLKERR